MMVSVALILSGIYFTYLRYLDLKDSALEKIQISIEQMTCSMDENFSQLQDISFALLATPTLRQWNLGEMSFDPSDKYYYLTIQELQDSISSTLMFSRAWTAGYINAIYMFADGQTIRLVNRLSLPVTPTDKQFQEVYSSTIDNSSNSFYVQNTLGNSTNVFYVCRMHDTDYSKQLTLILQLNSDAICQQLTSSDYSLTTSLVYDDTIYFSSDSALIGKDFSPPGSSDKTFHQSLMLSSNEFSVHAWIAEDSIYAPLWSSLIPYVLAFLISLLFFGGLAGFVSVSYTRFLNALTQNLEHLRQSDFDTLMPDFKEPELHEISNTFNLMVKENNQLFNCIYKQEILFHVIPSDYLQVGDRNPCRY